MPPESSPFFCFRALLASSSCIDVSRLSCMSDRQKTCWKGSCYSVLWCFDDNFEDQWPLQRRSRDNMLWGCIYPKCGNSCTLRWWWGNACGMKCCCRRLCWFCKFLYSSICTWITEHDNKKDWWHQAWHPEKRFCCFMLQGVVGHKTSTKKYGVKLEVKRFINVPQWNRVDRPCQHCCCTCVVVMLHLEKH